MRGRSCQSALSKGRDRQTVIHVEINDVIVRQTQEE